MGGMAAQAATVQPLHLSALAPNPKEPVTIGTVGIAPDDRETRYSGRLVSDDFRVHGNEVASLIVDNGHEGVWGANLKAKVVPIRLMGACGMNANVDVIGVTLRDRMDVYAGVPVRIGGKPLTACFNTDNSLVSADALSSLGLNANAMPALARKAPSSTASCNGSATKKT